jgi:hypothetical protein
MPRITVSRSKPLNRILRKLGIQDKEDGNIVLNIAYIVILVFYRDQGVIGNSKPKMRATHCNAPMLFIVVRLLHHDTSPQNVILGQYSLVS